MIQLLFIFIHQKVRKEKKCEANVIDFFRPVLFSCQPLGNLSTTAVSSLLLQNLYRQIIVTHFQQNCESCKEAKKVTCCTEDYVENIKVLKLFTDKQKNEMHQVPFGIEQ